MALCAEGLAGLLSRHDLALALHFFGRYAFCGLISRVSILWDLNFGLRGKCIGALCGQYGSVGLLQRLSFMCCTFSSGAVGWAQQHLSAMLCQ